MRRSKGKIIYLVESTGHLKDWVWKGRETEEVTLTLEILPSTAPKISIYMHNWA